MIGKREKGKMTWLEKVCVDCSCWIDLDTLKAGDLVNWMEGEHYFYLGKILKRLGRDSFLVEKEIMSGIEGVNILMEYVVSYNQIYSAYPKDFQCPKVSEKRR